VGVRPSFSTSAILVRLIPVLHFPVLLLGPFNSSPAFSSPQNWLVLLIPVLLFQSPLGVYLLDQATAAEFIDQQPVTGDHQATDVQPPTRKVAWNKDATLCLLRLYGNMKPKFDSSRYKNCMVWRELAALLQKEEFNYTVEQVEGRWKTLLAAYRRVTDHNNTSGNDRKDFEFMSEMKEILVDNPTIQPQCTISSAEGLRHLLTMKNKTKRKLPDAAVSVWNPHHQCLIEKLEKV